MSAALLPPLPATRDSPAIAPHLLHSPSHSPVLDMQNIMHDYRDAAPDSPHAMYYPPSPASEAAALSSPVTSPRGMLVVHSYSPASASPGSLITVKVDFHNFSSSSVLLRLVFGDLALPTSVVPKNISPDQVPVLGQQHGDWDCKIEIPSVGEASTHMAEVGPDGCLRWPLTLQALDPNGNVLDSIGFGFFVYESNPASSNSSPISSPPSRSRSPNKRSREDEDDDHYSPLTPTKRLAMDTEALNLRRMSVASADTSFDGSQPRPIANRVLIDGPSPAPSQTLPPAMPLHPHVFQQNLHLQTATQHQHMPPQAFTMQPPVEDYADDVPALVRTTQLVSGGERLAGTKAAQASVAVQGDLEAMKTGWSESERIAGRRLVQFWKRQAGTTLHISFAAIPQHQYNDNTIVVSCIYRDNTEECYITSVDVIYLLEALAGNRFEVEEKNRIRRNLEGFRPTTVSKSKLGTEEFFRIIMEFAAPKPRNIEKDVKVFEWGKLRLMLEKVFSKYSTVPLPPSTSSPSYDGPVSGPSRHLYPFPSTEGTGRDSSSEPSHLPVTRGRSPRMRNKRSSTTAPGLQDSHPQTPFPAPTGHHYTEQFAPAKYGDALDYNALESSEYAFGGMRFLDMSSELSPGFFKVGMPPSAGDVNGNGSVGVPIEPPGMDRSLDEFGPASPLSSNNSPISMSHSLSSPSSDGGQAESQDVASLNTDRERLKRTQQL